LSAPFRFKQFSVSDDKSAMKVGTDAVLLGVSTDICKAGTILDVGTGCGVIALILAQRSDVKIEAIDIDKSSIEDAMDNFNKSPWSGRLKAFHTSLQDYANESKFAYDLIVSNPPFFENSLESPDVKKKLSKHSDTLSHSELITSVARLLSPNGKFEVILPFTEREKFVNLALIENLFCSREILISPKMGKNPNRIILQFNREKSKRKILELMVRNQDNSFTEEYISLTKDFYLNF